MIVAVIQIQASISDYGAYLAFDRTQVANGDHIQMQNAFGKATSVSASTIANDVDTD